MAFLTPLEVAGRSYPAAYVKATIARCDTKQTVLKLQAWETQGLREQSVPSLPYPDDLRVLDTVDLPADNPIAYAYTLLEQSGEFPEATWNVNQDNT
jgi:hypothetical protein